MIAVVHGIVLGALVGWCAAQDTLLAVLLGASYLLGVLSVELFYAWRASREWDRP